MTLYRYVAQLCRDGFGRAELAARPEPEVCRAEVEAVNYVQGKGAGALLRVVTEAGTADILVRPAGRIRGRSKAAEVARELQAAGIGRLSPSVKQALTVLWAREGLEWEL